MNDVRVVSLDATHLLVCLPNIIKLSQIVWELCPAQDFGFWGDNYITKTVRVVSLARDMPTGAPLIPTKYYQNMSKVSKLWSAQG